MIYGAESLTALSRAKQIAAQKAAALIAERLPRIRRLGVGTGSTVKLVLEYLFLNKEYKQLLMEKDIYVSSLDTFFTLRRLGFMPGLYMPGNGLDLYFDGADEVVISENGDCGIIKGRGAALTREKILAYNSRDVIIVIDESKLARKLGEHNKPLPIEVVPIAADAVLAFLESRGVRASLRDECRCRDGPAVSDNYGLIIDSWPWGTHSLRDFIEELKKVPGVIEHGFFDGLVDEVIVGYSDGARILRCRRTKKNPAL